MTVHELRHGVHSGWGCISTEGPRLTSGTQASQYFFQVHLLENRFLTHHCLLTDQNFPTVECASWTHILNQLPVCLGWRNPAAPRAWGWRWGLRRPGLQAGLWSSLAECLGKSHVAFLRPVFPFCEM